MKNYICILFLSLGLFANAQTWNSLIYNEDQPGLELNPLKGIAALYGSDNGFPHSISGRIFSFGEIMNGIDDFNFDTLIDPFLEAQANEGRFGYLQINVDMGKLIDRNTPEGNTYLGAEFDLPQFLRNDVDHIIYDGTDTADNQNVPSLIVNYNDEDLMLAMLNFIKRLGERYNNDERVFIVHYGLYGIFGEWGLGYGKNLVPQGEDWEMSAANQKRITDAYAVAFPNKNLVARYPENVPEPQSVGYSDGLYFGATLSDDGAFPWFFLPKLENSNVGLNWKVHPIGGEVDPHIQQTLWSDFDNEGYSVTGDPVIIGSNPPLQNVKEVFERTHPTFLFQNAMLQKKYITQGGDKDNPVMWANALKATKRSGYTFHINEFRVSASGSKPAVEVNIQNKGIAPMYADWAVEFAYLDANGEVRSLGTSTKWNLRTIQPDTDTNYRSFISDIAIPDGTHTLVLRIVNPLETMTANAKPVRFANTTQDIDKAGWLTLGQITIIEGNAGVFPVEVTAVSITPDTATMGFDSQQQLSAQVIPANATNPAITWASDRPATASVDENGLVTTYDLVGDVEITAYTVNGLISSTTISVEPFWEIPRRVEAEGYSLLSDAQVNDVLIGPEAGARVIGNTNDNTRMEYIVRVDEAADFVLDLRASSPPGVGVINILDENNTVLATVALTPQTGSYDIYDTYTSGVFTLPAGEHTLTLDVVTSAFNLNWIEFKEVVVEYTAIPGKIEAEEYSKASGVTEYDAPAGEDGGKVLGNIDDGDWIEYAINVTDEADFRLDFRAATPFGNAELQILKNDVDLGKNVVFSGGNGTPNSYTTYATYTSDKIRLEAGNHILRFVVVQSDFNLNWIEFKPVVKDDIISIEAPDFVERGSTANVTVNYSASQDRDIQVVFQLDHKPWTVYNFVKTDVSEGTGTLEVEIPIPNTVPVADYNYQFQVFITTDEGDWKSKIDNLRKANIDVVDINGGVQLIPNGDYFIKKATSNVYVNATGASANTNSIYDTSDNSAKWTFTYLENGEYEIRSVAYPGSRLEVPYGASGDGAKVATTSFTGERDHIIWKAVKAGEHFQLVPKHDQQRALDIWEGNPTVHLWGRDAGNANQILQLVSVDNSSTDRQAVAVGEELSQNSGLRLYPNPVQYSLHIDNLDTKGQTVQIVNAMGHVVYSQALSAGQKTLSIDVRNLLPGVYLLKTAESVKRFMKE